MRKYLFSCIASILILSACKESEPVKIFYGERFDAVDPISAEELLGMLEKDSIVEDVLVQGVVEKSCSHSGCWMTLANTKGKEVLVTYKDDAFKTAKKGMKEKKVVLKGYAERGDSPDSYKIIASGLILN